MQFKKHTIVIDGSKTFYWQKNVRKEKVLVFLHGFPGNHRIMMDMARNFSEFRVIIPDMPACGQSEPMKQPHILKNYAEWLNNFLEELSINKASIVGYSFGSRVALTFCDLYENRVERLVLVTPVAKADSLIAKIALFEYEIAEFLPESLKKMWLDNKVYKTASNMILFKSSSKKRRQKLIDIDEKETKHLYPETTIEIFNEFSGAKPISEGRKINTKTLLVACDQDEIATVKSVEELSGRFSGVELKIIKNAGHIVPGESPKKLAKIIYNWLINS